MLPEARVLSRQQADSENQVKTDQLRAIFENKAPYLLLLILALLGHGLLLLNDGVYWDGWLLESYLKEGNWADLNALATEAGMPMSAYFYWLLNQSGLLPYFKTITFFLLLFTAAIVYLLGRESRLLTRAEAVTVAALSLVYPAYQTTIELGTFRYPFFYALFLLGILLLWRTARPERPLRLTIGFRLILLLMLFLSFNLNSLLVFYFPFLFVYFWQIKDRGAITWMQLVKGHLWKRLDFVMLPFAYFAIKEVFFPVHGAYANYNRLNLDAQSVFTQLGNFIENAIVGQVETSLAGLFANPLLLVALAPVAYLSVWVYARYGHTAQAEPVVIESAGSVPLYALLVFGVVLLFAGALPYAAVGLSPALTGWNTRHAILIALPFAFLVTVLMRPIWKLRFSGRLDMVVKAIPVFVCGALLAGFAMVTASTYVSWQARAVKDKAIISILQDATTLQKLSVFWIDDQYPLGGERLYRFYEWAGMFKQAWGAESWIGLQVQGYPREALAAYRPLFNKSRLLGGFNPEGCQAGMTIRPGEVRYTESALVWKYLQTRMQEPDKMKEMLNGVVLIDIQINPEELRRCGLVTD